MNDNRIKLKNKARMAGLLYLIMAITGGYGIMYVPSQILVAGDLQLTTDNILNKEFLFRTGILSNLICQTVFIFLVLKLYQLFKDVDKQLTRTMFALVLVAVPISFFIIFNQLYALLLLKEEFLKIVDSKQIQTLTMTLLKMYEYGIYTIGIFWGLWLIPFGQLVYKSGFIPKILGLFLIVGGLSYVIDATTFILFPNFQYLTTNLVGITSSIAELSMVLWLLIKGVNPSKTEIITNSES
jgi:hypothetical protein